MDSSYPTLGAQNKFIIELLELALKNNSFQFTGFYYQQIRGTAMGAPWALTYAGIRRSAPGLVGGGGSICLVDVPWPCLSVSKVQRRRTYAIGRFRRGLVTVHR